MTLPAHAASFIARTIVIQRALTILTLTALGLLAAAPGLRAADRDALYQTSTIDALLQGLYDGVIDVGSLKAQGNFGLGTVDRLDGELVVLDGEFYQIKADGKAYRVPDTMTTPFAAVTFFEPDTYLGMNQARNLEAMEQDILASVPSGRNYFYAVKITGRFAYVKARSVPAQSKPYQPLAEVTKKQSVFEFRNVEGALVGFFCPDLVKGVNVPGFHLHFLTADKTAGGHVLEASGTQLLAVVDMTPRLVLSLPDSEDFRKADLSKDKAVELKKVEK